MLIDDQLDVGIVVSPLKNRQVLERPLFYEELMVYHHPGHSFGGHSVISVNKLKTGKLWLLGNGHCFRSQVVNLCETGESGSAEMPYEFEGGSIHTLMKIIDKEGGYTLVPELAVIDHPNPGQVKRFAGKKPLREVSLVYTRKFVKTRLIDLLAESVRKAMPIHLQDSERGFIVDWR